jgi:hypothetical protein
MKIRPVEAQNFHTDGGTERHDELMSSFIILQRRLKTVGKGIYENQKLSGIFRPLRDPATRPRGSVHENRTGNGRTHYADTAPAVGEQADS